MTPLRLDIVIKDVINFTEFNANNIDPFLTLRGINSNEDDLIEWDKCVVGMIGINQFDAVS